jgi:hypothetical protein
MEKRSLFYAFLVSLGMILLLLGLCVGVLAASDPQRRVLAVGAVGSWLHSTLVNAGTGLIIVAVVAFMMHRWGISEAGKGSGDAALRNAGIGDVMSNWILERPSNSFYNLVRDAQILQVAGVTLYTTFIGCEWFPKALAERIKDPRKTTQILLLNPDGNELRRREAESAGRRIKDRSKAAVDQVIAGLELAGVGASDNGDHFRSFDHAPTVNFLRFDNLAYAVLLMHGDGGISPALQLTADGLLFERYLRHFANLWADTDRASTPTSRILISAQHASDKASTV